MKFGLFLMMDHNPDRPDTELYDEVLEQAVLAEELGYDSIWLTEHHFTRFYGRCPSPLLLAVKIGSMTKRIRIGVGVRVLPLDHPLRVAEEAAQTDLLIGGRLDLGVGTGYAKHEFESFGVPIEERYERFNEGVQILKGAWTQEPYSFEGKYYKFKDVTVLPRPVQSPHTPLWGAVASPASASIAAAAGNHIMAAATGATPNETLRKVYDAAAEGWVNGGHPVDQLQFAINHWVYAADSVADAKRDVGEKVEGFVRHNVRSFPHVSRLTADEITYDKLVENQFLVHGDPDTCAAVIAKLQREVGLTQLMCRTRIGGVDRAKTMRSMEIFGRHVIPRFRNA